MVDSMYSLKLKLIREVKLCCPELKWPLVWSVVRVGNNTFIKEYVLESFLICLLCTVALSAHVWRMSHMFGEDPLIQLS
ncbi:hypothetical protein GWK47_040730 [Chionoecetes opilio]|uniref:Uncharacterized protein n=1 Tax=Chionoecetes opilio TaxID=41210 RepID=A0A8J4YBZ3_CHIOP|nr:hypothetical protein GWK47_040730 [Chionoecetes opilio]